MNQDGLKMQYKCCPLTVAASLHEQVSSMGKGTTQCKMN